jgi:hypothetical protein
MTETRSAVRELIDAPYGHKVWRDDHRGHSHVMLTKGKHYVHAVRETFDEAVFAALDRANAGEWDR